MESGQGTYAIVFPPGNAVTAWDRLAEALNCSAAPDVLTCVRAADSVEIKRITEVTGLYFTPAVDDVTQLANPSQARSERRVANVPLMIGNNAQEGRIPALAGDNVTAFLESLFPNDRQLRADIKAAYSMGQDGVNSGFDIAAQIGRDYISQCVRSPICLNPFFFTTNFKLRSQSNRILTTIPGLCLDRPPQRRSRLFNLALHPQRLFPQYPSVSCRRRLPRHPDPARPRHLPSRRTHRSRICPQQLHAGRVGGVREESAARARVESGWVLWRRGCRCVG